MSTKYTPGPWTLKPCIGNGLFSLNADSAAVATLTMRGSDDKDANARLIALAPEMLAALKAIAQSAPLVGLSRALELDIQNAIAVINKAEGDLK